MILTIRPATTNDVLWIAPRLREEDARELETATRTTADAAVLAAFYYSQECYSIRLAQRQMHRPDDHPSVLFGVTPDCTREDMGVVWMVSTSEIIRAPMSILREARHWLDAWQERYPGGLHNCVDLRNDLHVRWLKLLGCSFKETVQINGQDFQHFIRHV